MEKFEIKFKTIKNIFSSGDTVYGLVFIVLKKTIKARSIKIFVSGKTKSKWDRYNPATKAYVPCQGEDSYINAEFLLWDGKKCGGSLKHGTHEFPFDFILPNKCPPSFEGEHGKTRYFCKAVVDRPWHLDNKAELKFIVKPRFDLNELKEWEEKEITLPKNGYAIGETITPDISITNFSTRTIQKIDIALIQFVTYAAKYSGVFRCENGKPKKEAKKSPKTKKSTKRVAEQKMDIEIPPGNTISPSQTSITIPDLSISFTTSPIIKIEYFLNVELIAEGLVGNSVSVEIPIVIGTIPIEEENEPSSSNRLPSCEEEWNKLSIE